MFKISAWFYCNGFLASHKDVVCQYICFNFISSKDLIQIKVILMDIQTYRQMGFNVSSLLQKHANNLLCIMKYVCGVRLSFL